MSTTSPYDHEDGGDSNTSTVSTPNPDSHKRDGNAKDHTPEKKKVTRRSVACKSCHSLKVKCTPADINNPGGPCIRCLNSKRRCEIDLTQPRKRRKKGDKPKELKSPSKPKFDQQASKVVSNGSNGSIKQSVPINATAGDAKDETIRKLQDQINSLQSELSAQRSIHYPGQYPNAYLQRRTESVLSSDIGSPIFVSKYDLEKEIIALCESSAVSLSETCNELKLTAGKRLSLINQNSNLDILSRGVLTLQEAEERLQLYKTKIYASHPLVEIPESVTVDQLRKEKPFLFNAIMSVSNVLYITDPFSLERALVIDNEAMTSIAIEILVCGSKSSELIFSLLLLSLWYNSPELFRSRRYHLLNSLSVSLLHDVGIASTPTYVYKHNEETIVRQAGPEHDPHNLQNDSLILILYFTSVSFSLILRRSIYVKWTPYVEECFQKLKASGIKKWVHLALFLQLNHELERIHNIIHYPDSGDAFNPATKFLVVEFQKNLDAVKSQIDLDDHAFNAYYYSVEAYLHEPILREIVTEKIGEDGRVKLSSETINLVSKCTTSCLNSLDHFTQMTVESIATIPLFYSARIIYTAGMLLRLRYLILSLPSHIEKDMVPATTITSIQKLNRLVGMASSTYTTNHFLKKLRLVIQLFIQTYATQVQELLKKHGDTLQNFQPANVYRFPKKDMNEMERLHESFKHSDIGGLFTTGSGKPYRSNLPLDLLSYAAAARRDSTRSESSPGDDEGPTNKPPCWPEAKMGDQVVDETTFTETYRKKHFNPIVPLDEKGPHVPNPLPPPASFSSPRVNSPYTKSPATTAPSNPPPASAPGPPGPVYHGQMGVENASRYPNEYINGQSYNNNEAPINNGVVVNNVPYPNPNPNPNPIPGSLPHDNMNLAKHLANADSLETSYMALNDEFWVNLLSTDSDKINFTNGGNNWNSEEVFFMG